MKPERITTKEAIKRLIVSEEDSLGTLDVDQLQVEYDRNFKDSYPAKIVGKEEIGVLSLYLQQETFQETFDLKGYEIHGILSGLEKAKTGYVVHSLEAVPNVNLGELHLGRGFTFATENGAYTVPQECHAELKALCEAVKAGEKHDCHFSANRKESQRVE